MDKYIHTVQYYETDKMGITHHSNYIRWMEEARCDLLKQVGWPYEKMEELGVISPVTAVECKYKISTTYAEKIAIRAKVEEFKGVKLKVSYTMENEAGKTVFEGKSEHCFLSTDGRPMILSKKFPDLDEVLTKAVGV